MAFPVILFNGSASGSDTAASGAGPATALTGANATTDGGGTVVTLPNADLSGVAVDGSHAVWLATASGRQWGRITAKAASGTATANVTVSEAFTGGLSAQTYGLGGKRKTYDHANSRKIFADAKGGWTIRTEQAGGFQNLTSTLVLSAAGDNTNGPIVWEGDSATSRAVVGTSTAATKLVSATGTGWYVRNHQFTNGAAGANKADGFQPVSGENGRWIFDNCLLQGFVNGIESGYVSAFSFRRLILIECNITGCTGNAIQNPHGTILLGCNIVGNTGDGVNLMSATNAMGWDLIAQQTVFQNNNRGVMLCTPGFDVERQVMLFECVFQGNQADGIRGEQATAQNSLVLINNIFQSNGAGGTGYGVNLTSKVPINLVNYNNAYRGNTSGARNNVPAGQNEQVPTGDPFVDQSIGDFDLDLTANEGMLLRNAGWPQIFRTPGLTNTVNWEDIGISRHQDPTGGGSAGYARGRLVNTGGL